MNKPMEKGITYVTNVTVQLYVLAQGYIFVVKLYKSKCVKYSTQHILYIW